MTTARASTPVVRPAGSRRGVRAGNVPPVPPTFRWTRLDTITTAVIGVIAVLTRFVGLSSATAGGTPVFDEKHYVPQAWDMVRSWINPITGGIESNPGYGLVVHPPLAKQIIAYGEWVFGYTPLGWRTMAALFGAATVLLTMAVARRLSGSTMVAFITGIFATADGVLLVSSRFGMLDIFQVLFIVGAAWAILRDHQQMHARIHSAWTGGTMGDSNFGPRFGFRWWRFTAGVFLGLALGVKWSGLYYIAFFGLLSVALDLWLRKRYGVRRYILGTWLRDVVPALASLVLLPALLYIWSWRAWFASETSVYRHAVADGTISADSTLHILPDSIAAWLYYHISVLEFHGSLTTSAGHTHPWDSKPWSWLVAGRPILYFSSTDIDCAVGSCRRMIYLFGTPAIWWLTIPVLLWAVWSLFLRKRIAYLVPVVAFMAGFLPWLMAYDRQMYFFYAAALAPFIMVMLALACQDLWGKGRIITWAPLSQLAGRDLPLGSLIVSAYVALVVMMFLAYSPILYGYMIPDFVFDSLMWLPSWR